MGSDTGRAVGRLGLSLVGAYIGSYFGQPSLGYALGSLAGGALFPQVIRSEGPRLGDQQITTASYGQVIPRLDGTVRVAGSVIDLSPRREVANEESSGKGGSSQEVTTYSYFYDVHYVIAVKGPIAGIRRIWKNGNLVYTAKDDAGVLEILGSVEFADGLTVYKGDGNEQPDPTFEAIHGVGNVPAYTGLASVVVRNLDVTDMGGRLPNLEFEIVCSGMTSVPTRMTSTNYIGTMFADLGLIYNYELGAYTDTITGEPRYLRTVVERTIDLSGELVQQTTWQTRTLYASGTYPIQNSSLYIDSDDFTYFYWNSYSGSHR